MLLGAGMPVQPPDLAPGNPADVQVARANLIDPEEAGRLAELLGLVAEPTRARILFALGAVEELCVGDLALAVGVSEDSAGYALKLLRMAGLVTARKAGRTVFYRLAEGFPHEMLEHCLRDLLSISNRETDIHPEESLPMSEATISVPGIHCDACEKAIKAALAPLPGVDQVDVDLDAKIIRVGYTEPASAEVITRAIEEQGYDVAAIEEGRTSP